MCKETGLADDFKYKVDPPPGARVNRLGRAVSAWQKRFYRQALQRFNYGTA